MGRGGCGTLTKSRDAAAALRPKGKPTHFKHHRHTRRRPAAALTGAEPAAHCTPARPSGASGGPPPCTSPAAAAAQPPRLAPPSMPRPAAPSRCRCCWQAPAPRQQWLPQWPTGPLASRASAPRRPVRSGVVCGVELVGGEGSGEGVSSKQQRGEGMDRRGLRRQCRTGSGRTRRAARQAAQAGMAHGVVSCGMSTPQPSNAGKLAASNGSRGPVLLPKCGRWAGRLCPDVHTPPWYAGGQRSKVKVNDHHPS